jgi:hypothetical protein
VSVDGDVVSIEGHRLEQLTEELQRLCHGHAEVLSVDRFIVGGIAGFFGREYFRIEARTSEQHLRTAASGDTDERVDPDGDDPDEALDAQSFAAALAAALEEQGAPAPARQDPPEQDAPTDADDPGDSQPDHHDPTAPLGDTDAVAAAAQTWAAARAARGEPPAGDGDAPAEQEGVFVHLALPELNLSDLLGRLDPLVHDAVLPPEHGIVAVVGDPLHAARTAQRLAEQRSGDADQSVVLLVRDARREQHEGWPVLTDLSDAIAQRRRWRNRPRPTFVAIALDLSEEGIRWVRNALIALEPVQVRYAAPAWRSPDEHGARIEAVAQVDAVDLVDLDAAEEPSAFLGMSPSVATLDGRPVSPGLWAAYLLAAPTPLRATDHDLARSCT